MKILFQIKSLPNSRWHFFLFFFFLGGGGGGGGGDKMLKRFNGVPIFFSVGLIKVYVLEISISVSGYMHTFCIFYFYMFNYFNDQSVLALQPSGVHIVTYMTQCCSLFGDENVTLEIHSRIV